MPKPLRSYHRTVLQAFYEAHKGNPDYVYTFRHIGEMVSDQGVAVSDVRRFTRVLKRRGYVEYHQAFSMDDNLVSGSGHQITAEGILYLQALESKSE